MKEGRGILLITVGRRADPGVEAMVEAYKRRLPASWQWDWVKVPDASTGSVSPSEVMNREGHRILEQVGDRYMLALAVQGTEDDSLAFAERLRGLLAGRRPLALVIGGAYGLSDTVLARADHLWSLSRLTFPHQLVPLVIAEQIYRAHTILTGHPYHKA